MESRLSKGHLLGLFCAVVWSATFISTKVLLEYLSPIQLLFSRFLLGYIALGVYILTVHKNTDTKLRPCSL